MHVMNTLIFTFYNNIALNLYHSVSFFTNHNTVNFDYNITTFKKETLYNMEGIISRQNCAFLLP